MKRLIAATQAYFESSCGRTPQYLSWHRLFKREFTKYLNSLTIKTIQISKPNHFDASGFFQLETGQIFYFRIEDLRWSKTTMLLRTAKSFTDYTGGPNRFVCLTSPEKFETEFKRIIQHLF